MQVLAIDIGTTTISVVLVESNNGEILKTHTVANDSNVTEKNYTNVQNVSYILDIVSSFCRQYQDVDMIGITCQMHGILYVNQEGEAVSNLYTWQDESGNEEYQDGLSYVEFMSRKTGYPLASGYGLVTHFVLQQEGNIICTIGDYIAMYLAGAKKPIMHISNAASLGLFDLKALEFDQRALKKLGIDASILPEITKEYICYPHSNISVAIGDNQASFIGAVSDIENSILVNIGTGSQISYLINEYRNSAVMEVRPFDQYTYLFVGAPLCGGESYAILKKFFYKTLEYVNLENLDIYAIMEAMAEKFHLEKENLTVSTKFLGTRKNSLARGEISNINIVNFTPEQLVMGVLEGMVDELLEVYEHSDKEIVIGSGNGLHKNKMLRQVLGKRMDTEIILSQIHEEAAFGAAIFAMVANGVYSDIKVAKKRWEIKSNDMFL